MKKIIVYLFALNCYFSFSQEGVTVPITTSSLDCISGTYFSDIDFLYQPYIGTWQGNWNSGSGTKTFTVKFEKITHKLNSFPNGDYYYMDLLIGKYTVTETSTGIILSSTMNIINSENAKIKSLGAPHNNKFSFWYGDSDLCYASAQIYTELNSSNLNQLDYRFVYDDFWIRENCQYTSKQDIPVPIPTVHMTLTKVN